MLLLVFDDLVHLSEFFPAKEAVPIQVKLPKCCLYPVELWNKFFTKLIFILGTAAQETRLTINQSFFIVSSNIQVPSHLPSKPAEWFDCFVEPELLLVFCLKSALNFLLPLHFQSQEGRCTEQRRKTWHAGGGTGMRPNLHVKDLY